MSQSSHPCAFGTSGISAAEQPRMPEASRDRSMGIFGHKMRSLLAITVLAAGVLLAEEGEDWLPVPDDFIWPKHSAAQLTDEKTLDVKALPGTMKETLREHWPEDELPDTIHVRTADLNGDGRAELFVCMRAYSGSGGSFYEIFTPRGDNLRAIGCIQGSIILCKGENGWLRIEGCGRAGGGEYTRYLLAYRDGEYREVRNEGHNYTTGKVEIWRSEPQRGANPPMLSAPEGGSR